MFRKIDGKQVYDSFEDLLKDVKSRYRRTHQGETEGLHYQFELTCNPDGKSGLIRAERLETPDNGTNPKTETLLIQDNRILAHVMDEEGSSCWLE